MREAGDNTAEVMLLLAALRSLSAEDWAGLGEAARRRETIAIEEAWADPVDERYWAARASLGEMCDRVRDEVLRIAEAALERAEPSARDKLAVTDLALQGDVAELAAGRPMTTNAGDLVAHLLRLISDLDAGAVAAADAAEAVALRHHVDSGQVISLLSVIAHVLPRALLETLDFPA